MALCLGQSLIDKSQFDPVDQMNAFGRWGRDGYMSSNGICFDMGGTVGDALCRYSFKGAPFSGSTNPKSEGNGSIMRLAPISLFYCKGIGLAINKTMQS